MSAEKNRNWYAHQTAKHKNR